MFMLVTCLRKKIGEALQEKLIRNIVREHWSWHFLSEFQGFFYFLNANADEAKKRFVRFFLSIF